MRLSVLIIIGLSFIIFSCGTLKEGVSTTKDALNKTTKQVYQSAIENAMSPSPEKVATNLVAINKQNENLTWKTVNGEDYLLVVTWKGDASYYEAYLDSSFYPTQQWEIWVTTSPQLLTVFSQEDVLDTNMRLKQMLGLPPNSTYNYFVESWVKPANLFRPCPDKEITDQKCDLCIPNGTDSSYINWVNDNRINHYYQCELYDQYPWSQLGYTYDCSVKNIDHVGLSEFVIKPEVNIIVEAIYTTADYLQKSNVKD